MLWGPADQLRGDGHAELPPVTSVPPHAFYGCEALRSVGLPASLTVIGEYAFAGSALESIDLASVMKIDEYAFAGCNALKSVTVPSSARVAGDAFAFNVLRTDLPACEQAPQRVFILLLVGGVDLGHP